MTTRKTIKGIGKDKKLKVRKETLKDLEVKKRGKGIKGGAILGTGSGCSACCKLG